MRQQDLNKTREILTEIDKLRGLLARLDTDTLTGQQQAHNISQLINNVYKTELENILRSVVTAPEHRKAS